MPVKGKQIHTVKLQENELGCNRIYNIHAVLDHINFIWFRQGEHHHPNVLFQLSVYCKVTWIISFLRRGFEDPVMSKALFPWLPSWLTQDGQDSALLSSSSRSEIQYVKRLREINALQQILFKILEIKMSFLNCHTERGAFLKCSVRPCCTDSRTNSAKQTLWATRDVQQHYLQRQFGSLLVLLLICTPSICAA